MEVRDEGVGLNRSGVSFDIDTTNMSGVTILPEDPKTEGETQRTTTIEEAEITSTDTPPSPQHYSNTPSTPGGMRKSLIMPTIELGSSTVMSLEGQSPVEPEPSEQHDMTSHSSLVTSHVITETYKKFEQGE